MKYKVTSVGEAKPLADFYNGECFEAINYEAMGLDKDDPDLLDKVTVDDRSLMMVVGIPEFMFASDVPKNIVFVIDFETAELDAFLDGNIVVPVVAEMVTDEV